MAQKRLPKLDDPTNRAIHCAAKTVQGSKAIAAQAKTPGASERRTAANNAKFADPAVKQLLSKKAKERWTEPEWADYHEKQLDLLHKNNTDPDVLARRSEAYRLRSSDPAYLAKLSASVSESRRAKSGRWDVNGEMLSVIEMSERSGVKTDTLKWRMNKGMSPLEAMKPGRLPKGALS